MDRQVVPELVPLRLFQINLDECTREVLKISSMTFLSLLLPSRLGRSQRSVSSVCPWNQLRSADHPLRAFRVATSAGGEHLLRVVVRKFRPIEQVVKLERVRFQADRAVMPSFGEELPTDRGWRMSARLLVLESPDVPPNCCSEMSTCSPETVAVNFTSVPDFGKAMPLVIRVFTCSPLHSRYVATSLTFIGSSIRPGAFVYSTLAKSLARGGRSSRRTYSPPIRTCRPLRGMTWRSTSSSGPTVILPSR